MRKAMTVTEEPETEKEAMKAYRENGDFTWLTASQYWDVSMERMQQGAEPLRAKFGSFEEDKPHLDRIMGMAKSDMEFWARAMEDLVKQWRTGGPDKDMLIQQMKQEVEQPLWIENEETCEDFFNWFKCWLAYAGYSNPGEMPRGWKAIIMTTFPMLGLPNGSRHPKYLEDPVPMLRAGEKFMTGQLALQRLHSDVDGMLGSLRTYRLKFTGMI